MSIHVALYFIVFSLLGNVDVLMLYSCLVQGIALAQSRPISVQPKYRSLTCLRVCISIGSSCSPSIINQWSSAQRKIKTSQSCQWSKTVHLARQIALGFRLRFMYVLCNFPVIR